MAVLRSAFAGYGNNQTAAGNELNEAFAGRQRRTEVRKSAPIISPQDRLSDHRIGLTLHSLPRIMQGELDEMIDALASDEQSKLLQEQLS